MRKPNTSVKRTRACTPRSRNGCATCRKRRIKCDESRPSCQRCELSGWTCPGYRNVTGDTRDSQSWHNDNSARNRNVFCVAAVGAGDDTTPPLLRYNLPFKVPGSRQERRALHYYTVFATRSIGGQLAGDFWSRSILERCQHAAPLRHATAALGQLHVEYIATTPEQTFAPSAEALECYGRAVKSLRGYIESSTLHKPADMQVVLMCALVFSSVEMIRGDFCAAGSHRETGLRLLNDMQQGIGASDANPYDVDDELVTEFARMDLQATFVDDSRLPVLRMPLTKQEEAEERPSTLHELTARLSRLLHSGSVFLVETVEYREVDATDVPPAVSSLREQLLYSIEAWEFAAWKMEQNEDSHLDQGKALDRRNSMAVWRLQAGVLGFLLHHSLDDGRGVTGMTRDLDSRGLMRLAEEANLATLHDSTCISPSNRHFSLHIGTLAPLYFLALKTCESEVRDTALALLQRCRGHREGFFEADTLAKSIAALASRATGLGACVDGVALEHMVREGEVVGSEMDEIHEVGCFDDENDDDWCKAPAQVWV